MKRLSLAGFLGTIMIDNIILFGYTYWDSTIAINTGI